MEKINVSYFDGVELDLSLEEDTAELREVLKRFSKLSTEDRLRDSRHVYAYFCDIRQDIDDDEWLDEEMGDLKGATDIWRFVTPGPVWIERGREDDTALYVIMEAECSWEEEHGLMLVWKEGERLTKIGGFDGSPTNEGICPDNSWPNIVYFSFNDKYLSRLW